MQEFKIKRMKAVQFQRTEISLYQMEKNKFAVFFNDFLIEYGSESDANNVYNRIIRLNEELK